MENVEERHDISDAQWALIAPLLPGQRGQWGGIAKDNRKFINGVFWILRTGAPWRDLPSRYGKWGSVYQRFRRWRNSDRWAKILDALSQDTGFEWLMIDASHCKVHPHAAGARGGNQTMSPTIAAISKRPARDELSFDRNLCASCPHKDECKAKICKKVSSGYGLNNGARKRQAAKADGNRRL